MGGWRPRRLVLISAVVALLATSLQAAVLGEARAGRVAGHNRVFTAVEIAFRTFPDGADTVYIARSDVFADALVAGVLTDGPVLLADSRPCGGNWFYWLTLQVNHLDPARVVALGGTEAICDQTLADVAEGRPTERLAGANRYETAIEVARAAFPDGANTVYLANGQATPDAVAGGALTDGPILLVSPSGATDLVRQAVASFGPERVVALGGQAVVADETLTDAAGGVPTSRLAGPDRFETAVAIARAAFPAGADTVYLARGDVFADAVAAGSLTDGPVILVPSDDDLPAAVQSYLSEVSPCRVVALGGQSAISAPILTAARDLACGNPTPPAQDSYDVVYGRGYARGMGVRRFDASLIDPLTGGPFWQYLGDDGLIDVLPQRNQLFKFENDLREDEEEYVEARRVVVRDLESMEVMATHEWDGGAAPPSALPASFAVSPDAAYVAWAVGELTGDCGNEHLVVSETVTGEALQRIFGNIHGYAFLLDNSLVVSTSAHYCESYSVTDGRIVLLDQANYGSADVTEATVLRRFDEGAAAAVAVDPSGTRLAYILDGELWLTSLEPDAPANRVAGPDLSAVGFSPDGDTLALVRYPVHGAEVPVPHYHYMIPADSSEFIDLSTDGDKYQYSAPGDGTDGEDVGDIIAWTSTAS